MSNWVAKAHRMLQDRDPEMFERLQKEGTLMGTDQPGHDRPPQSGWLVAAIDGWGFAVHRGEALPFSQFPK